MGCTAFEEDVNVVEVEVIVEEWVILELIEDEMVKGEGDDTEGSSMRVRRGRVVKGVIEDAREGIGVRVEVGKWCEELREFGEEVRVGGSLEGRGRLGKVNPVLAVGGGPTEGRRYGRARRGRGGSGRHFEDKFLSIRRGDKMGREGSNFWDF